MAGVFIILFFIHLVVVVGVNLSDVGRYAVIREGRW
jgi:hypothetical protein